MTPPTLRNIEFHRNNAVNSIKKIASNNKFCYFGGKSRVILLQFCYYSDKN